MANIVENGLNNRPFGGVCINHGSEDMVTCKTIDSSIVEWQTDSAISTLKSDHEVPVSFDGNPETTGFVFKK